MSDHKQYADQAHGLRDLAGPRSGRIIPVLGNARDADQAGVLTHLAMALQSQGHRVLLVDADRALLASSLGIGLRYELSHWLDRECSLEQVLKKSPEGLSVMSAAVGIERLQQSPAAQRRFFEGLSAFERFDICILVASLDRLHGLLGTTLKEVWMVSAADAASITSTYARIKGAMHQNFTQRFRMIYNKVSDAAQCEQVHVALSQTVARFTRAELHFGGAVELDPMMARAQLEKRSVFTTAPDSPLAYTFEQIAIAILERPLGTWPWAAHVPSAVTRNARQAAVAFAE